MTIENIIGLILYIIPGFLAMEVYHAAYPVRERDNFILSTWSIIYGAAISSFVKFIDSHLLKNALHSDSSSLPSFSFLIVLIVFGLLVGFLGVLFNKIRFWISQKWPKFKKIAPIPQSTWAKINAYSNIDWAVVFLDDGSIYLGWIKDYTYDPNSENQDFLLSHASCVDESLNIKYEITGCGVYMNTKNIKRIEFVQGRT